MKTNKPITTKTKHALCGLLSGLLLLAAGTAQTHASLMYSLVQYAGTTNTGTTNLGNPFRISGTITTDGTLTSNLSQSNIQAWTVNVTNTSNNLTLSYSGAGTDVSGTPFLSEFANTIQFPTGRGSGDLYFYQHGTQNPILHYQTLVVTSRARNFLVETSLGTWNDNIGHTGVFIPTIANSPVFVPLTPVPEAGTALFGIACVGVSAFRRRRRA